jgi:hypothetical protein
MFRLIPRSRSGGRWRLGVGAATAAILAAAAPAQGAPLVYVTICNGRWSTEQPLDDFPGKTCTIPARARPKLVRRR